jgi:hypothetical protein
MVWKHFTLVVPLLIALSGVGVAQDIACSLSFTASGTGGVACAVESDGGVGGPPFDALQPGGDISGISAITESLQGFQSSFSFSFDSNSPSFDSGGDAGPGLLGGGSPSPFAGGNGGVGAGRAGQSIVPGAPLPNGDIAAGSLAQGIFNGPGMASYWRATNDFVTYSMANMYINGTVGGGWALLSVNLSADLLKAT